MKRFHFLAIALGAAFVATNARSGPNDLEVHCLARQADRAVKSAPDGGAEVTKEHWLYDVTIENKTFNKLENLEVKYVVFVTREQLGVKAAASTARENGSFTLPLLQGHEKKSMPTNPVEITKRHLVGNWIYSSGAKPNANDALIGIWIRVMQNGQQFYEYANPSNLLKEKWE